MALQSTPTQFNARNPAVKRIIQEIRELQENPSDEFWAQALEEDIFEWHFTIKGPADTVYEGGIYHGRIILPAEYPMKPPSIVLLTPNGRFETNKKICLTITGYHPEYWQPAWGIRTVCMALIGFLPTPGGGSIGSLDWPDEEKKKEAIRSRDWVCKTCGTQDRELLTRKPSEKGKVTTTSTDQPEITFSLPTPTPAPSSESASASSSSSTSSTSSSSSPGIAATAATPENTNTSPEHKSLSSSGGHLDENVAVAAATESPTSIETFSSSTDHAASTVSESATATVTETTPATGGASSSSSSSASPAILSTPVTFTASASSDAAATTTTATVPSNTPTLSTITAEQEQEQQQRRTESERQREKQRDFDRWILTIFAMILAVVLRKLVLS